MQDVHVQEAITGFPAVTGAGRDPGQGKTGEMIIKHGFKRPRKLCKACKSTFSPTTGTVYWRLRTPRERVSHVLHHLAEAMSIRATSRVEDIKVREIQNWLLRAGSQANRVSDFLIRDVDLGHAQMDEMWTFVLKKQKNVDPGKDDPREVGDTWKWTVLAWKSRLRVATHVGKRTLADGLELARKLLQRCNDSPVLFSTDGLQHYKEIIQYFLDTINQDLAGGEPGTKVFQVQVVKKREGGRVVKIEKKSYGARKKNVRTS